MTEERSTPSGDRFESRHIGPGPADRERMLEALGLGGMDELMERAVPAAIRAAAPLALEPGRMEAEVLAELRERAAENRVLRSLIGAGFHDTFTPPVIQRNVLENPAWYTAYTPYQPEISQGRLEALLSFQTMVSDLTGLEVANASLLDEASAAAEAMTFCRRVAKARGNAFFVAAGCHPQTIACVRTRAEPIGVEVVTGDPATDLDGQDFFGVLLQFPDTRGAIGDYRDVADLAHRRKALVAVAADPLALTLLRPPGELGADLAVGSTQRFGVPLGYGGPHAAYFATRAAYKRQMPGRLVGVSVDRRGGRAYRLALQTREQHIRREKATSNICTAQVLLAIMAAMYACYHGPRGLRAIAQRVHGLARALAEGLRRQGWEVPAAAFFDTVTVATGERTEAVLAAARARGMNLRRVDAGSTGIALDETCGEDVVAALLQVFGGTGGAVPSPGPGIPEALRRRSGYLNHPVFNRHHSETEMLRYLRSLADKDLALDRAMIPLGSCTMKLNATTEMLPVTWEGFSRIHPFAPRDQARGYRRLISELETMLCACTGFDAVSFQPNAGSQGELAGLLAIRAYHRSRGEPDRDLCLIPSSAHGTNPASAQMAGLKVAAVQCDAAGNVDLADLRDQAARHAGRLAALMITYPSTHGVFEESIVEICRAVHEHGGQVYIDGANLNALLGVARLAEIGGDVAHLNLHKTFCIPHGGGGPGVGPIGVRSHLIPFLPGHGELGESPVGPVAAAPWGSAGILPISWAYIRLMGGAGLAEATRTAILSANTIARRLAPHYPVLYTGPGGMVAHECIVDLRPIKERTGITVDDVAKRLIDYGFHAPTMSFPVAGTLMIEPTESEPLSELDRFCEAMIKIRDEIRAVEQGRMDPEDNPLKNAPHTCLDVVDEPWDHPYTRLEAAFPVPSLRERKYWSPVARVDNVYGDRNLVCACPPVEAYR